MVVVVGGCGVGIDGWVDSDYFVDLSGTSGAGAFINRTVVAFCGLWSYDLWCADVYEGAVELLASDVFD